MDVSSFFMGVNKWISHVEYTIFSARASLISTGIFDPLRHGILDE
jgi:hypothetical protein